MHNVKRPLVSAIMITYGHEQVIGRAIKGVLMQRGDFDLELIIADDCSPDNTEAVVKACLEECVASGLKREQDQVIYHRHKHNKGMAANFLWTWEACRGDYIAICEGDDEWTDENKVILQVHSLENSDAIISFHEVEQIANGKARKHGEMYNLNKTIIDFQSVLQGWPATVSFLWRNIKIIKEFRILIIKTWSCDQMLLLYTLNQGDSIYIDKVMARHYKLPTGASNSLNSGLWILNRIESLTEFIRIANKRHKNKLIQSIYFLKILYAKRHANGYQKLFYLVSVMKDLWTIKQLPKRKDIRFIVKSYYK